jgi:hypothetical protein
MKSSIKGCISPINSYASRSLLLRTPTDTSDDGVKTRPIRKFMDAIFVPPKDKVGDEFVHSKDAEVI